jgi:imidazolonepropionase-like amidohydrolase
VSATSLAALSIGMTDEIGTVAPGMKADLVAVEGNPLMEPKVLEKVRFVMKGGRIVRRDGSD